MARQLLLDINRLGLPTACEYLDTISPQFFADLIAWAMVGKRTCASRPHRELASGLSTPVGFCKGEAHEGFGASVAVDAVRASAAPHAFLSVSKQGVAGIVETTGNSDCHVVLSARDTAGGHLADEAARLRGLGLPQKVMLHCHAAEGDDRRTLASQLSAVQQAADALKAGEADGRLVMGVFLPAFLLSGRQDLHSSEHHEAAAGGHRRLAYGMSVTEPCMDWASTEKSLEALAAAVRERRAEARAAKKARH